MSQLAVLGATGSIGLQTLEVADRLGMAVTGLAAKRPSDALVELAARYPDAAVVVVGGTNSERRVFAERVPNPVTFGSDAVIEMASVRGRVVVNGIVGVAGLASTLAALRAGNRVGLANKESMVAAGELVNAAAMEGEGELIPVDSEHSALFQCLHGEHPGDVARLILTASGGPFRGRRRDELTEVTPDQALAHPTWEMGGRITIDSATLVNKGLEVIEAHHLFTIPFERIEVVVHPQSIVHSAVEFIDGALKAHLGHPDMRIPIQFALSFPRRASGPGKQFSLSGVDLSFEPVDHQAFPALELAYAVGRKGGTAPAVYNAADEVAVEAFLAGRIGFLAITRVIEQTVEGVEAVPAVSLEAIMEADGEARRVAGDVVAGLGSSATGVI